MSQAFVCVHTSTPTCTHTYIYIEPDTKNDQTKLCHILHHTREWCVNIDEHTLSHILNYFFVCVHACTHVLMHVTMCVCDAHVYAGACAREPRKAKGRHGVSCSIILVFSLETGSWCLTEPEARLAASKPESFFLCSDQSWG